MQIELNLWVPVIRETLKLIRQKQIPAHKHHKNQVLAFSLYLHNHSRPSGVSQHVCNALHNIQVSPLFTLVNHFITYALQAENAHFYILFTVKKRYITLLVIARSLSTAQHISNNQNKRHHALIGVLIIRNMCKRKFRVYIAIMHTKKITCCLADASCAAQSPIASSALSAPHKICVYTHNICTTRLRTETKS